MRKKRKLKTEKQKKEIVLWELVKKYIRCRDRMVCQKCRKEILNPQGADTSHVFCKKTYKSLKYDEYNLKILCMWCHKWWHNNPLESSDWFKTEFPDRWRYLMKEKNIIRKITEVQIDELLDHYQDLLVGSDLRNIKEL